MAWLYRLACHFPTFIFIPSTGSLVLWHGGRLFFLWRKWRKRLVLYEIFPGKLGKPGQSFDLHHILDFWTNESWVVRETKFLLTQLKKLAREVTGDWWQVIGKTGHIKYIFFFLKERKRKKIFFLLVILSPHVKVFSVTRMQDC